MRRNYLIFLLPSLLLLIIATLLYLMKARIFNGIILEISGEVTEGILKTILVIVVILTLIQFLILRRAGELNEEEDN